MTNQKPCPFCGGEAALENSSTAEMSTNYRARCKTCKATTPKDYHAYGYGSPEAKKRWADARADAIAAWNTRAQDERAERLAQTVECLTSWGDYWNPEDPDVLCQVRAIREALRAYKEGKQ